MAEEQIQNDIPEEETVNIDLASQDESIGNVIETEEELSVVDKIVYATNKLKQPLTSAPTYNPTNFYEQFAHYNDSLYVNINNSWQNLSGSTKAHVRAYVGSTQSIPTGTDTTIEFDTESYDTGGDFNTSTYTFTAPRDGKYLVNCLVRMTTGAAGDTHTLTIRKNAGDAMESVGFSDASGNQTFQITNTIDLSSSDTVLVQMTHNAGADRNLNSGATISVLTIDEL